MSFFGFGTSFFCRLLVDPCLCLSSFNKLNKAIINRYTSLHNIAIVHIFPNSWHVVDHSRLPSLLINYVTRKDYWANKHTIIDKCIEKIMLSWTYFKITQQNKLLKKLCIEALFQKSPNDRRWSKMNKLYRFPEHRGCRWIVIAWWDTTEPAIGAVKCFSGFGI